MKFPRYFSLLLALAMLLCAVPLAGLAEEERPTLTILMAQDTYVEDYETNAFTKVIEDSMNVNLDFELLPAADAADKLSVMISSGQELPDVVNYSLDITTTYRYAQTGAFLPLNDYYEQYGDNVKKVAEMSPGFFDSVTCPDGNIYSVPIYTKALHDEHMYKIWINQTWLDALNLEMPTSLDELKEVLIAFKEGDPNGNGQADEIPLSFWQGWGCKIDSLFGWFGLPENDTHIRMENDTAIFVPGEQAYYDALVYFNDLYNAGLLDKEGFSHTNEQYMATSRSNPTMYGVMIQSFAHQIAGSNSEHYAVLPPFEGTVWNVNPEAKSASMSVFVTTACEYPEVMMRYFDYCNSDIH